MSRIGKVPVEVPDKVSVDINVGLVKVKGPNGELSFDFGDRVNFRKNGKQIIVEPIGDASQQRSMWGTARTVVNNMVVGVSKGFTKCLEFNGVGYKAIIKGQTLELSLGYSHPINYVLPKGISAKVIKNVIEISGCDKESVGQISAKIRSFRPPEPYKGKGIKYQDEIILRKAGKSGGK